MEEKVTTIEELESKLLALFAKLDTLVEGTPEWNSLVDAIEKLYKVYNDAIKIQNDYSIKRIQAELEDVASRREADYRKKQLEMEARRNNKVKPDTVLTCAVIAGVTIGLCVFEAKGHLIPSQVGKLVGKMKFF